MKTLTFETAELPEVTLNAQQVQDWGMYTQINQQRLEQLQTYVRQIQPQVSALQAAVQSLETALNNPQVRLPDPASPAVTSTLLEFPDRHTLFPPELLQLHHEAVALNQPLLQQSQTMLAIANSGLAQLQALQAA